MKMTNAAAILEAWKTFARANSRSGADNVFAANGHSYSFDARPRALANGALQGRFYRQDRGETVHDIGGFKIDASGAVAAIPDELLGVLPVAAAEAADPFERLAALDVEDAS